MSIDGRENEKVTELMKFLCAALSSAVYPCLLLFVLLCKYTTEHWLVAWVFCSTVACGVELPFFFGFLLPLAKKK